MDLARARREGVRGEMNTLNELLAFAQQEWALRWEKGPPTQITVSVPIYSQLKAASKARGGHCEPNVVLMMPWGPTLVVPSAGLDGCEIRWPE